MPTNINQAALQNTFSKHAPRVTQRQDGGYDLNEHGNVRALIGDEVGRAQTYASDFATKFPTGFQPGVGPQSNAEYDAPPPKGVTGGGTTPPPGAFNATSRDAYARGTVGTMEGFNTGDYGGDVKARTSVKNTFGRIASRYAASPNSMAAMMADPDFKAAFPNARLVPGGAGDKIDFGGVLSDFEGGTPVGIVDVGTSFDPRTNTGRGWAWQPDGGVAGPGVAGPGAVPPITVGQNPNVSRGMVPPIPEQSDLMAQILAALQAQSTPDGQDLLLQSLR